MKLSVYASFDSKAAFFSQPYFLHNDGVALRAFMDMVNRPDSPVSSHPEDYSLFCIGSYEDTTGELIPCLPRAMVTASSVMKPSAVSIVDRKSVESVNGALAD